VPEARLAQVAEQYARFGGRSPINDQNRALIDALVPALATKGLDLPVYWGNRNSEPFLTSTLEQMAQDGRRHAAAFVTSAYSSYSGCRQYRDDLARSASHVGAGAPQVTKLRQFFNHPGFVEPFADGLRYAVDQLPPGVRAGARIVFTAHSIPASMARSCRYVGQLQETARLVASAAGTGLPWELAYQSRSGPPAVPWLEPDVNDTLERLAFEGVTGAVLVPIGFVSDHMEVLFDLDTTAAATAERLGVAFARAATPGTDGRFVDMVVELVAEVATGGPVRALGDLGATTCMPSACCPPPERRSAPSP